ncbi:MAG: hypothetical protein GX579_09445 [Chloroflexi bacterium]|jgi:hypothetical protein|nr:hypothetical protein [Chloroflexota bacterium]
MAEEFDFDEEQEEAIDFEDEFDRLRAKTARTSAVYDDMEFEDLEEEVVEERSFFGQFTPAQRFILALLLLLDILAIGLGVVVVFNIIPIS